MLTIATVPKPFLDPHINITQRNAIQSWLKLKPKPQIILFGNDPGIAEAAKEFGVLHVPEIKCEFNVPVLSLVFDEAKKLSNNPFVSFINTDIILLSDFMEALKIEKPELFLMAGRRWDMNITESINFDNPDWEKNLLEKVKSEAKLHGLAGMDYFVFPKNLELNMPPFVAGRPGYDSWLVYRARTLGIPVIDATLVATILHQNHGYKHRAGGIKVLKKAEGKRNIILAGGFNKMLTLRDADWILTKEGLKKPEFPRRIFSMLSLFYPWRVLLSIRRKIKSII
ncbi:MAG: hypothetical protein PHF44_02765 [Candidatus Pacebacteria bacterium]|nr:hypothetical protein [Candidatus Paceibacterota bacterium]